MLKHLSEYFYIKIHLSIGFKCFFFIFFLLYTSSKQKNNMQIMGWKVRSTLFQPQFITTIIDSDKRADTKSNMPIVSTSVVPSIKSNNLVST